MNFFIFGVFHSIWIIFAADFICLFLSQKPVNQQTKGLRQLPSKSSADFGGGVPPPPYFNPIRSQSTPDDPMLRASAEGRNPKMRKPGMSRVKFEKLWTAGALACALT